MHGGRANRREFIAALGSAAAWPQMARSQTRGEMRRVGILLNLAGDDAEGRLRLSAVLQALRDLGWIEGSNLRIDPRWGAGSAENFSKYAQELIDIAPDVILATGTPVVDALQRVTRTVPIVFVTVIDPVGAGFVESLARPGRNITGFALFEYGMSGKWAELLKQIMPGLTQVAVIRDQAIGSGTGQLAAIQAVAPSLAMELRPVPVSDPGEIERSLTAFAGGPNRGLIVTASTLALVHRDLIVALAARYKLPAVYPDRTFVTAGGLISYGPNRVDPYQRAAGYIDRILKGEKPADLPVQSPVKYEVVINLNTAKTLGLQIPPSVLARADEVIE
jgi:putative tryptophan/tyrosine transport system substrate-binding protein